MCELLCDSSIPCPVGPDEDWYRRRRLVREPSLRARGIPPDDLRHVETGRSGTTRTAVVVAGATSLVVNVVVNETETAIVVGSIGRTDTTTTTDGTGTDTARDGESGTETTDGEGRKK
jgi:hypothetical protein